ncbi:hypothetical protein CJU90_6445 [Yarrowia sp. C11]|nr:hypothetical protein CJU90_6445 [Yarrowia sp. C11]KAG5371146.1 hypothetical protein CKK34_1286 [Yarrowia sp. E02]
MPSINILCSSALPFVPTKFQIDAVEHETVLVVKKRLCQKLVELQREGSVETSTESYNREQEHLGNPDNLKLIFGGKILPDPNELPNLAATNPTFHLHLLPISLDKEKLSIIERFRRGSTSKGDSNGAAEGSTSTTGGVTTVESQTFNVRLLSNQAKATVHYNVQQQSLYNMDGEASLADLKHLLINSLGNETAVKSLDLAIQRKFVVFNSKGQDFSDDTMKIKDINNFGRPPHSQGTNVVIFYRFVLGEFEEYQLEEENEVFEAEKKPVEAKSNNPFAQEPPQQLVKGMVDTDNYGIQFDRETAAASVGGNSSTTSSSNPLAGAFTAQLNLDGDGDEKGKEVADEVDEEGDVDMIEEKTVPVETSQTHETTTAPTPTIKHLFIKDTSLGDFHLNPADVKTGSCTESEWVAISPRELTRLKRLYREFGNAETEPKRRKSGEFTRETGEAMTSGRDMGGRDVTGNNSSHNGASASTPSSASAPSIPSTSSESGPSSGSHSHHHTNHSNTHNHNHNHAHSHPTPHGRLYNDTANSTDTEADVPQPPSSGGAPHSSGNTTPASDQYRQFQQFLRWADTQHEDHAEPAEFDYRQFQQFLQWGQVQPPTQQPLVDFSFQLRISPPPWNIRQRIREMIPPRDQLRQRAVVAIRQLGDVLVFLLQLFVFYIMVLGRINNDYMFYASCGLTVIIFVGYRFRQHLERFRPASFNVGSEELSRVAQIFPAVNYDQEEPNAGGNNNEAVREALENPDNRHARGVRIGAAFFGSMIPAVHSRWLADNRQRRVQLDAQIRQQEREGEEAQAQEGENDNEEGNNRAEQNE